MSVYTVEVVWRDSGPSFEKGQYSRAHTWRFDGGIEVPASASPSVVKPPYSEPQAVDPEEAFVAAIASCHMLTFLYEASRRGFVVSEYSDQAEGTMTKNEARIPWVSDVVLSPRIVFEPGKEPTPGELRALHEAAHHGCFIANSVKTNITVRE
jgi:organic hydroperoxide reductase OsmC/OhrA